MVLPPAQVRAVSCHIGPGHNKHSSEALRSAVSRERGACASDVLTWRHIAPIREELRNARNKSGREPTRGRSTHCGNGRLIPTFHGIARTPASRTLPMCNLAGCSAAHAHWSRVVSQLVQTGQGKYGFVGGKNRFSCVSCLSWRATLKLTKVLLVPRGRVRGYP